MRRLEQAVKHMIQWRNKRSRVNWS